MISSPPESQASNQYCCPHHGRMDHNGKPQADGDTALRVGLECNTVHARLSCGGCTSIDYTTGLLRLIHHGLVSGALLVTVTSRECPTATPQFFSSSPNAGSQTCSTSSDKRAECLVSTSSLVGLSLDCASSVSPRFRLISQLVSWAPPMS